MIIFIITLAVTIIGVLILINTHSYEAETFGVLMAIAGAVVSFVMVCLIILAHAGVDVQIEENRIEYEALCERLEIANSYYEDVSKSDVAKDIAQWNKMVYSSKHWAYNPWTSWFYSRRVVDELEMIERRQNETTR